MTFVLFVGKLPMLLMVQKIPFPTTWDGAKNPVNSGISTANLNRWVYRISEPSTGPSHSKIGVETLFISQPANPRCDRKHLEGWPLLCFIHIDFFSPSRDRYGTPCEHFQPTSHENNFKLKPTSFSGGSKFEIVAGLGLWCEIGGVSFAEMSPSV